MSRRSEQGFSLLEALIAAAVFAAAIVTLVQLVMRSAAQTVRTEMATVSLTLADAKLEQLRAAQFDFDAAGLPIDDPAIATTPPDAHDKDSPPYLDRLDRFGEVLAADAPPAYIRRWSITAIDGDPHTRMVTVCVSGAGSWATSFRPACVWTIRSRQP